MTDIEKLRQLGELRDSGILTDEEFESEKYKILEGSNPPPSPSQPIPSISSSKTTSSPSILDQLGVKTPSQETMDSRQPNSPVISDQPNNTSWIIGGVIAFVILLLIIFSMGGSSSTASVSYSGCWSGAFSDGDFNIVSIDGCGNESFDCGSGGYCGINAQKQDDSSARLCVSVGSNEACTTAAYGVASV